MGVWVVAWAMIAAAAGGALGAAAMALARRTRFLDALEFDGGYALSQQV